MVAVDERLIVYGGASGGQPLREIYILNSRTSYWSAAAAAAAAAAASSSLLRRPRLI